MKKIFWLFCSITTMGLLFSCSKTVKDRKRILVDIRQKIEIPNQKEYIQSTQLLHLAMAVSGLYILLLGIGIGISLMVLLYFMNNLAVVSTLLTQFI